MGRTVGLMYNLGKYETPEDGEPPDAHAELDSEQTVLAIADALASGGHQVVLIEGNEEAYAKLQRLRPDVVFNICEGIRGASRESQVPAILEMMGIPYTGSGVLTLAVALDKAVAKKVFQYHGVPTPAFRTFDPGEPITWAGLQFPLFVKPNCEGSSMGISPTSKVNNPAELVERVQEVHRLYRQTALVEEFLDGREFTVGIVGNQNPTVFPIREILFDKIPPGHGNVYSYQFKQDWGEDEYYACPAVVEPALAEQLRETALSAFKALGCRDVGRVDLRLDAEGIPHVLEINPLPGLSPGWSDLCQQAAKSGWSYEQLINGILDVALERTGQSQKVGSNLAETA